MREAPLSEGQRRRYWREVAKLADVSKAEDREEIRQDLHRRAAEICTANSGRRCDGCEALLGKERISLNDFSRRHGFDQLLAAFSAVLDSSNLNAQLRQINQARTRKLWRLQCLKKQLAALGQNADRYVATVLQERFGGRTVEDLPDDPGIRGHASQLTMLLMTLSARVNDMRKAAGLTIRELDHAAGVPTRRSTPNHRESGGYPNVSASIHPKPSEAR